MGFKCGIVGLPNVGKSTLFNALTQTASAAAANYPFCTIEPNVGQVPVPDPRLAPLARLAGAKRQVPNLLSFVDIAGLVHGASRGEGLGNQFLGQIREVDAIVHVLRCFDDDDVSHVDGSIDPLADAETVETELMLADLESLERRLDGLVRRIRGGDKAASADAGLMERVLVPLRAGRPARETALRDGEDAAFRRLHLLSAKPVLYVCNVDEADAAGGHDATRRIAAMATARGAESLAISAKIEAEVALLEPAERALFLADLGLEEPGLDRLIRAGLRLLRLITFFTAGPKEAHAWTLPDGASAHAAAGCIHTDLQRGFIAVEAIAYDDYVGCDGEQGAKTAGRMRLEGRDYRVRDGDVLLFRFNV